MEPLVAHLLTRKQGEIFARVMQAAMCGRSRLRHFSFCVESAGPWCCFCCCLVSPQHTGPLAGGIS